jgi:RNA polymerase sigma-70 factor, ECF subfamily
VATFPDAPEDSVGHALVERLRGGDRAAADELFRRYHDEMLFAIRARLGTRLRTTMQSEDVLQSVALEAFRDLPTFEPRGAGSFSAWLRRIVVTKIHDLADRWSAQKRDAGAPRGESALVDVAARDDGAASYVDPRYEQLERALALLPDDLRAVVILRRVEGLPSREVAERLGTTDEAVRQMHTRALARLALHVGHERGAR